MNRYVAVIEEDLATVEDLDRKRVMARVEIPHGGSLREALANRGWLPLNKLARGYKKLAIHVEPLGLAELRIRRSPFNLRRPR